MLDAIFLYNYIKIMKTINEKIMLNNDYKFTINKKVNIPLKINQGIKKTETKTEVININNINRILKNLSAFKKE